MNLRQFNQLNAARRGYAFLTVTPLPAPLGNLSSAATQQIPVLGELVTTLDTKAAGQTAATGAITDRASAAREAAKLLHSGLLSPVKRAAKLISKSSAGASLSPDFASSIAVPRHWNYHSLLTAASGVIQTVTPYKALFVSSGLSDDFLDQIGAQANVLSQAIAATATARTTRVGVTTEVVGLLHEVRSVMHALHIGVTAVCRADRVNGPGVLAGWRAATAIRRTPVQTDIPFVTSAVQSPALQVLPAGQPVGQTAVPPVVQPAALPSQVAAA